MPQKAKFSKEEIINSAVSIVETSDLDHLTARLLGQKLGTSARPIFTTFKNMDEVIVGVNNYAKSLYDEYIKEGLCEAIAFKGVGTAYIRFAKEHPKLFQLLFMREKSAVPNSNSVLGFIDENYKIILNSITQNYNVSDDFAKELYLNMWIYTHGIAVLITNKMCKFSDEEISQKLTIIFKSLLLNGGKL